MSKHDAYLTCDICGKVVATIKGRLIPRTKPTCDFFNIPRYYVGKVMSTFDWSFKETTVKEDWCVCDSCLAKIAGEIRSKEVEK